MKRRRRQLPSQAAARSASRPTRLSDKTGKRHRGKRSGFDAAASNRHTDNHFADASLADINLIISADRATMQKRGRYETRNNSYLKGGINSFANEIVGTGPVLQMETDNPKLNSELEEKFAAWAKHCDAGQRDNLAGMLRTGFKDIGTMGEEITLFTTIDDAPADTPRFRIRAINPLRMTDPYVSTSEKNVFDGVKIDPKTSAPVEYYILNQHPGGNLVSLRGDWIPADRIIHQYFAEESEQWRGSPLVIPAIPIAAYLRRYTLAVVSAAEKAANISAVMTCQSGQVTQDEIDAMDELEIPRDTMMVLPKGWGTHQFKAEQPTGTYAAFKAELLAEMGRAIWEPYLIFAANAQGYNYSSGRLDLQDWRKTVDIVRDFTTTRKLEPIFLEWLREALMIPGYIKHYTQKIRKLGPAGLKHSWNWPGHEHVDPQKEANAQHTRLKKSGTTTLAAEYAKQGKDWETEVEQQYREEAYHQKMAQKYGVTLPTDSTPIAEDEDEDPEPKPKET